MKNKTTTYFGATIITMNESFDLFENGYITICDGKIIDIGSGKPDTPHELIDASGKIIIPGLINAHTHLSMTLYRGLADDLPLKEWLEDHIWPAEAKYTNEENIRKGARLGLAEMISTGTTTFADMYFFADAIAEETQKAGLRAVMGEAILDFNNGNNTAIKKAEAFIERWKNNPLVYPGVILHSPYACSKNTLMEAKKLADKHQVPVSIHVAETKQETENSTNEWGLTPIEYLNELDLLNSKLFATHCVWLNDKDILMLSEKKANVVHCPTSNLKLGSGIAPIPQMLENNINIALGTDGCASNNNLNMIEEMRMAALIHKGVNHNPTLVSAREALKMATLNGAKALGIDQIIGSLEPGKAADLVFIDTNNTFMNPIYDYYSAIVYSMDSSCIERVMVEGKEVISPNIDLKPGSFNVVK